MLTISTLQKLTSLHSQINGLTAEIDRIKGIMAQLANDACSVTVTITVGRETRKEQATKQESGFGTLDTSSITEYYNQMMHHMYRIPYEPGGLVGGKLQPSRYEEEVKHSFDEGNGMRLLNHMLQLKKAEREALMNEAQSIIQSETI